jgi:hypothetical protein
MAGATVACVNCGKEQTQAVCAQCVRDVLEVADRERIPLVGGAKPAARRIGFDPARRREG